MKKYFITCMLLLMSFVSNAVEKKDFAYGYSLEVDGDGAIYTLNLNKEIYQGLIRSDRGDLRIFNGQGATVPHYIRRLETRVKEQLPDKPLKLFPLYHKKNVNPVGDGFNVRITTNEKGAIIDMNYGQGEPSERILKGYILDASELEQPVSEIIFNWSGEQPDFVMRVDLEGSDNLKNWQRFVNGGVLSNLHYAGHTLVKNQIEFSARKYRYLRLTWQGDSEIKLEEAKARFPASFTEQARQWSNYQLSNRDEKHGYYYFDTSSVLPADRLAVEQLQRNTLVRVTIESSRNMDGPWYTRYSGLLYDLQYGAERVSTTSIHLPVVTDRFWRVQVLDTEGSLGSEPVLKLGWLPEQLLFVAQGESPFTLAYGSATVERMITPLPQLLLNEDELRKQGKLIKSARLGSVVQLGDKSRLQPPRPPIDWKQYVLWFVLMLGVVVLAVMVMRLYKQMEKHASEE